MLESHGQDDFVGLSPLDRARTLAFLKSTSPQALVACAEDYLGLAGFVTAFVVERPGGLVLSITRPDEQGTPVVARDNDENTVRELLETILEHGRALGCTRAAFGYTPKASAHVLGVAESLGMRFLETSSYTLESKVPGNFAAFLKSIGRRRSWKLRNDLRTFATSGLRRVEDPSAELLLAECDRLHETFLANKGCGIHFSRGYLRRLLALVPRENLRFSAHAMDGRVRGFTIGYADGEAHTLAKSVYVLEEDEAPKYCSVAASWIETAVLSGARTMDLGIFNDAWKSRVGARPVPYCYGFLGL